MDNYISTKKKKIKYNFITNNNSSEIYSVDDTISYFYQICIYANPNTNTFHMRKFAINSKNEFINIKSFYLRKSEHKKFFKKKKDFQFRSYPAYSLDEIDVPSLSDILMAKSSMVNDDNLTYDGYAQF
jgi:hypothetical protein